MSLGEWVVFGLNIVFWLVLIMEFKSVKDRIDLALKQLDAVQNDLKMKQIKLANIMAKAKKRAIR